MGRARKLSERRQPQRAEPLQTRAAPCSEGYPRQLMPSTKLTNTTLAALLCLMAFAAGSAEAQSGPCILGKPHSPRCRLWNGKVTFIGDGDTLNVRMAGQNKKKPGTRIRITGIQAMEEYTYTSDRKHRRGECHANEATARLEYLVKQSKGACSWRRSTRAASRATGRCGRCAS